MSKTRIVIVCAVLLNVVVLIALYLNQRAENKAAEARAAMAAQEISFEPSPGAIRQMVPGEGLTIVDGKPIPQ